MSDIYLKIHVHGDLQKLNTKEIPLVLSRHLGPDNTFPGCIITLSTRLQFVLLVRINVSGHLSNYVLLVQLGCKLLCYCNIIVAYLD